MKNFTNLIQREEMARNMWVYLCTQQGVKSAKSMSAGSEAEGRVTEGRASIEHPFSIHSASIEHPLQSGGNKVKTSLRFLRYVAMIFAVLVMGIGNVLGADVTIADIDFTTSAWSGKTFSQGNTTTSDVINGIYFYAKDAAKQFSLSDNTTKGLTFPNNNMSSGNYYFCIPLTDINGEITVTLTHKYNSNKASFNYVFIDGRTTYTAGNTNGSGGTKVTDAANSDTQISFTVTASNENHSGHLCIGRNGSNYKELKRITVTTPASGGGCGETAQSISLSASSGTICGTGTTTFTVSGGSGTGALSVSSSDPTKATASIDNGTVTVTGVAAGSATITVTKACDATYAAATATYSATVAAAPTANAGEDKTTEPGTGVDLAATAAESGCSGAWTIQSGPNTSTAQLSSTSSATATFTPTVAGTYTLRWTVTNTSSSCSAYDEMTVSAAVCSISSCGNATLTYPIYTSGDLTTSNLFSGATSSNATAVSVGASPAFTGVTVSAATKGSSASAGACYAKSTPLTGKMKYSASSKSSSYYIDFPFTVNTGYTFTPCDVQVVIQPVSSNQAFTVEITNGTNVYGTSTATLNAGVMEPIIGLTSPAEMSAGNYAIRLYPHGGDNKEFRMGANVILKGTTAAVASDAYGIYIGKNNDNYTLENLTNTSGTTWSKTITLDAGSYYEFKVKKTPSAGDAVWYGNNGKITATTSPAWDFNTSDSNCKLYTTVAGSYTFSWDASTNKLTVTYPAGSHSTKRVYMACGSTWCNDSPKFYVHAWGVTEEGIEVQQNACGDYYADIIWYNDYFQFTRNASNATAYDNNQWNVSQDLTYDSEKLLWTCTGWSDSKGTFSSSAYSPTTYTITFAGNSNTGGSMTNLTGIACGANQAITANAYTRTGYSFAGWKANVNVTIGGSTVTAGTVIANSATIQNISQNITLTAQWTAVQYDVTLEKGSAPAAGSSGSAKVYYDAAALTNISHATWAGHVLTGYYTSNSGGTKVLNADGTFAATNVSGYITDNKWTRAENTTLKAQWTCVALTVNLGGDPATPAGGSPIGTEYKLTCSASTGAIASYQWKQNTTASTTGAVDAEGTGATTASFSPVPAAAGTYYYYCVATDACDNSVNTSSSGAFTFTAPVVPYATSIDFEAIIDESGTGAAWKTTMEGRNYTLTQADGSKWSLDGGNSGAKPADKGLKIKETGDNAGKITFTVRANQTVELKVGTLAGTNGGTAKFSTDGGSSYSNITGAATASTGASVVTTYTGATDRTYVFKTNSASWNILQHIIIGYKITYDKGANGTGTIDPMYKTHGTNINLSSSTFTYAGHTQDGWSTSDGGSKVYELGASYTSDAPITLYPHWVEDVVVPTITATKTSPDYVSPDPNNVVLSISTTGASAGWYYRVKNTGTAGYQTPDNTPYNTATWTMTSGLALGANNFVVELYNGSGVKQAESGTITVTAETAYPITIAAGAGGSVSPSGEIKANESGNHIHPAITATPNSGYHFVNWTYSNSNATVADASSASTTVNYARGACTITANFEADAPAGTTYYLVTSTAQLNTTDTYVIMADDKSAMMGVASENNAYLNKITSGFTVAADKSTVTVTSSDVNTLTLKSESDAWNLFGKDSHYITTNSTVNGNLYGNATSGSGTDDFVFSFADGKVTIKRNTTTDYHIYYTSGTGFNQSTSSTNIRLYTSNSTPVYTVTYDLNGGTGTVPTNRPEKSGTSITLASSTGLTKDGFTFDGWLCSVNSTKYAAGASYTMTAASTTFTAQWVAAESYSITYHCDGADSGCPSSTTASALPNPLPSAPTKDGYTFGGWFTDSEKTVAAVAGAAISAATTLYAKWTVNSSSECITITNFATSNVNNTCGDGNGKIFYGYKGSVSDANALTITSNDGNDRGQNSGAEMRLTYNKLMRIYANNTTNAAPATFSNVTSVSFKWKFIASGNSGNTELTSSYTVKVGSTTIANAVSITGKTKDGYQTVTIDNLAQLNGYVEIKFGGSSSSYNVYLDDIEICTSSLDACTTPVLPTLNNQSLCEGADIAAWDATVTNASAISAAGETVTYSWKKKGNATELANTASFDLGASAAESQAGTYVVTVTVSKTGYASSTATKEVTLTVNEATEVTAITADKATVYPTNSVTLTATANMDATWQWFTCTNAEGAGESSIGGATSASYTIASAGSAGTYYYKVKATGACGTDERVYALTVTAASECEKYFWFVYAADATSNGVINNRDNFFGSSPKTGSSNSSTYKFTLDGTEYTATRNTGDNTFSISFTVPEGSTATLALNCKGSSSKPIYLIPTSGDPVLITDNSSNAAHVVENIAAGTYKVGAKTDASASWTLAGMAVQVCTASTCTDATPTITAANTTVCVGSELSISSTGYETGATFQWQKLNSSTSTWDNISGATSATYTVTTAAAEHAGSYRLVATKGCARTSNTVTISVPSVPNFGSTVPATRTVMATLALSISDVEASDATSYTWYKSADATYDAGTDTKVGTAKELLLASDGEAAGATYYLFCVASNACGSTTSSAITVNVTALVEEDCATKGNEGAADFGFTKESGVGESSVSSQSCWTSGGKAKYLTYTAPDGKYFDNAKVTVAVSSGSVAAYGYSTDGSSYTYANLTGLSSALAEKTIDLPANVTHFRIGRNFDPSYGVTSGTFYLSKICFEYTDACTATTVTPSTSSVNYEMGGAWINPTFTLSVAGTLTYSSSDEEIASVDESGNVTFNGTAGTVTITASYAGATIADVDYCASEGSYTITVSCEGGAPKVVADGSVNMSGCNSSVTLHAKKQDGTAFDDGTYQWFRNGTEIDGATSSSYTAKQAGVYTVARTNTSGCTSLSTNNATVTSATVEPEVTKLVPFHYYHVDKTYSAQMKDRHLFSVKGSSANGTTGKNFKLTMSRNGSAETDMTTAASIWVNQNEDHTVDTVMIDLNKLSGKYAEGDELVLTCYAVDCSGTVSNTYKEDITINVIGATPTLALICSGTNKAAGTRKTSELTVGGDFLTGYNKADLCQQTGNTSFDANTEWELYTRLKEEYIVTPVNGYAIFNKLNYEPFDILLLTDYPKASKSDAAATVLDDMADLCDYRPMLSFKAHMVAKTPSKWAAKGFTTSPVVPENTRTRLNIVCYAHPMFTSLKSIGTHIQNDNDDPSQIVYTMLTGGGYESSKGLQGFELAAADNFVTIGLVHYNATPADGSPSAGLVTWTPGSEDRMLVAAAERQANPEARMILFAVNCGAQSKFTETGSDVVLECLKYLLSDWTITPMADCSFTFDNGAGNPMTPEETAAACEFCTGTKGDGKWSTAANWGPDYVVRPGKSTEVKIVAPVTVDHGVDNFTPIVRTVRITDEGSITIPSGSYLEVTGTIRHLNDKEVTPTENSDIIILSDASGNGSLIFNNDAGDTKATVQMYTTAQADVANMSAAKSTWQYIGTPHNDVASATWNYMGAWLYQYVTDDESWGVIPNGGPLVPFRGYSVTHEQAPHTFNMKGSLTETTTADIDVPKGKYVVAANSWTAPIDINAITNDDMENITDKTIYFFNTGSDVDGTGSSTQSATGNARWAPGTYVSVPIHAASYADGSDDHIPSMQGFYVVGGSTNGTLHFDYNRHVRSSSRGFVSGRMHAPRRTQQAQEEPNVLKIYARGERYDDRLIVLERQDFTRTYDSGWDGEAWGGSDKAPMLYITNDNGVDEAVSAIPDYEGTVLTFRAGEDEQYRLDFNYSPEAPIIYLLDTDYNIYTRIVTGNSYSFYTFDQTPHQRFIITRNSGSPVVTDINEAQDNDKMKSKPIKFIKDGKIFILVNGVIYDSTGKKVK